MRACLVFICLLAFTFALSVKSKPHGKHHGLRKASHTAREQDEPHQVVPTLVTLEASSQEQDNEELGSEGNKEDGVFEENDGADHSTALLLSEEELVELLKKEAEEEEEVEERELKDEADKAEVESGEALRSNEDEKAEQKKKKEDDMKKGTDEEGVMEESRIDEVEDRVEKMPHGDEKEKLAGKMADREDAMALLEETGSTDSEIPLGRDYAADSGVLQTVSADVKALEDGTQGLSKTDVLSTIPDDYDQDVQNTEAADSEEVSDQDESQEDKNDKESHAEPKETSQGADGKEEEKRKNVSGSSTKGKTKKQKKNQRAKNQSPQREEAQPGQDQNQQENQDSTSSSTDNTVHKAKRRRAGKWGPLVGVNPVQIRATVDLYPSSRPSVGAGTHDPESPADPCDNFHCKRGKMCKLDADNKPGCVCQDPSACPPSVNEFDHVCGTDNKTYDTSCELFATKCNLEGTKRGHRLHLDYTGPCKLIPPCVDTELVQFPLRMRDWLKNVLLQLYEHDSMSAGYLTPKQRYRVKKIFESERRLHAGDHSVELLAQDFEKNYNMYIYPVHWQFAQLDQHPSDRLLSHSELAPLRVPLVPMEHCTSRFFQECDADKDKQVSFKEWTSCFGIKNDDVDVNLLF